MFLLDLRFVVCCRHWLLAGGLWCCLVAAQAQDGACLRAFDVGSSGVRMAWQWPGHARVDGPKVDIDFLADIWQSGGIDRSRAATVVALSTPAMSAEGPLQCRSVAGGFSAWRMAERSMGRTGLAAVMRQIQAASGVPLIVIPQPVEGAYGLQAARAVLGAQLSTAHVFDLGGGSFQIAGTTSAWGGALGQKVWHRNWCSTLFPVEQPCWLAGKNNQDLAAIRALARQALAEFLPEKAQLDALTAISRPVTRGIWSALRKMAVEAGTASPPVLAGRLDLAALRQAINRLAPESAQRQAELTGIELRHLPYLVSDMVLVEALMERLGLEQLRLAEAEINNLPGLLADTRLYFWAEHYGCYLNLFATQGEAAYFADPAQCPAEHNSGSPR